MSKFSLGRLIERHNKKYHFIILLSFTLLFIISRLTVHLMDKGIIPDYYVLIGQTHVHHFNWGILLLAITGLVNFGTTKPKEKTILAVLYGIGLALTFDEFGMWLKLNDDYQSRLSYTAIIIIGIVLVNVTYMSSVWARIFRGFKSTFWEKPKLIKKGMVNYYFKKAKSRSIRDGSKIQQYQ